MDSRSAGILNGEAMKREPSVRGVDTSGEKNWVLLQWIKLDKTRMVQPSEKVLLGGEENHSLYRLWGLRVKWCDKVRRMRGIKRWEGGDKLRIMERTNGDW